MPLWLVGFLPEDAAEWQRLLTEALPEVETHIIAPPIALGTSIQGVFAILNHTTTAALALPEGLAGAVLSHDPIAPYERTLLTHLALPLRFSQLLTLITRWMAEAPTSPLLSLNAHWSLDIKRRELISSNRTISLTDKESELLASLLAPHAQEGVPREALLKQIWGYNEQIDSHTLETHIYRLRNKLQPALASGQGILTTPSGYRFTTSA